MPCPDWYNDDQQGFYYQEWKEIASGRLDKPITEDHLQAIQAEHKLTFGDKNAC